MDVFLVGNIAFLYAFNKVQPKVVVEKCIEIILDMIVPIRGAGETDWIMRSLRSLEQSGERTSREIDIRSQLRQWDNEFPFLHHQLIIRYAAGFLASFLATTVYDMIRSNFRNNANNRSSNHRR